MRRLKRQPQGEKAFIVRVIFTPKTGTGTVALTRRYTAVVEVLNDLVHRRQSESANQNLREKTIALDLARQAALSTFAISGNRFHGPMTKTRFGMRNAPTSWTRGPAITSKVVLKCGKWLKAKEVFEC